MIGNAERRRILLADDTEANVNAFVAMLNDDYRLGVAQDGHSVLKYVKEEQPDLILLGSMIHGMDGNEISKRIRADPTIGDIPILMMITLSAKEDRLRAVQAGANDFITQPIDKLELHVRMQSLLKMKEAQDAVKRHEYNRSCTPDAGPIRSSPSIV